MPSRSRGCAGSRSHSSIPKPSTASSRRLLRVADDRIQVEIGFDGSQIMIARVTSGSADELERALASGNGGVIALDAEDGRYAGAVGKVVYVKRYARESRVGFGAG